MIRMMKALRLLDEAGSFKAFTVLKIFFWIYEVFTSPFTLTINNNPNRLKNDLRRVYEFKIYGNRGGAFRYTA